MFEVRGQHPIQAKGAAMRKQLKNKRRSCGLCKPHKRGCDNRWKPKVRGLMSELDKEVRFEAASPAGGVRD